MLLKSLIDSMGLLEVKCVTKDSVSYLKVVQDKLQLHLSQLPEGCTGQAAVTSQSAT